MTKGTENFSLNLQWCSLYSLKPEIVDPLIMGKSFMFLALVRYIRCIDLSLIRLSEGAT